MPRTAQVTMCATRCMVLWSATKRATLPTNAFGTAFAQQATAEEIAVLAASPTTHRGRPQPGAGRQTRVEGPTFLVPDRRTGPDDQPGHSRLHGQTHGGARLFARRRPHALDQSSPRRRRRDLDGPWRRLAHVSGGRPRILAELYRSNLYPVSFAVQAISPPPSPWVAG